VDGRGLGLDWPAFGGPRGAIRLRAAKVPAAAFRSPPGRHYRETIPVRLTEETVAAVDAWIGQRGDVISRSEAIQRLLDEALTAAARRAKRKEKRGWACIGELSSAR
jgi:Arc/MetJ-type ribon-helix-helix transcriptional regulator